MPTASDLARLAEIEARAAAATAGPWEIFSHGEQLGYDVEATDRSGEGILCGIHGTFDRIEDAGFVAAARDDVPWLVSQLRVVWDAQQNAPAR